jgi:hypothetical protein
MSTEEGTFYELTATMGWDGELAWQTGAMAGRLERILMALGWLERS